MKTKEEQFNSLKLSGIFMLIMNILMLLAVSAAFVWAVSATDLDPVLRTSMLVILTVLFIINCIFLGRFHTP